MTDRTCSVDGCERKHAGRGMCNKHYMNAYYQANKEKMKAQNRDQSREWYHANRDQARANGKRWYEANKERSAETVAAWQAAHPGFVKENSRKHYQQNRKEIDARHKAWHQANKHAQAVYDSKIRANDPDADLTPDEWAAILAAAAGACFYCGHSDKPLEMEHMTPLSRGGRHTASNVVPSCMPCNRSKGRRTAEEFLGLI